MIVYGERHERVRADALLSEIRSISDPTEKAIRYGQWEAATIDALCPEVDDIVDPLTRDLPGDIEIRPQEGFAYYALYPEQYSAAARRFAREHRPDACVVVGIRSIGTTLSTVVSSALECPVRRFTVRPRGHPFDRRVKLSEALKLRIREHPNDWFLVVDEGPGLSGSSFTSVAEALNELGIPDNRIVFLPSHDPDPETLVSERARARWNRHRKYIGESHAAHFVPASARDVGGGLWRDMLSCDAAVQPYHERRKYLHEGRLWKFSGLAHYGRRRLERGRELAEAGFTPAVYGLQNGFLVSDFVNARPATHIDSFLIDAMARYLAHLAGNYRTGERVRYAEITEMVRVNTGLELPASNSLIEDQFVIACDGRMLPHEWVRTADGRWLKTDALDHHDDHFFPGCQDIAWDIAGAAVEFGIDADPVVESYLRLRPDDRLKQRVEFYTLAYLAYRIGYADMAMRTLGDSPDGRRFGILKQRYTAALVGSASLPITSIA